MAYTYSKIATYTVGSGGIKSIDFLNIPQTYTDLKLVLSSRSNYGNNFGNPRITINNNTSISSYSRRSIYAESGAAGSEVGSETRIIGVIPDNATANTFGSLELYIPNYKGSTYKSYFADSVTENNSSIYGMWILNGIWNDSSPITSIGIAPIDGNFVQYTSAHLYGIKAEI